MCSPQLEWFIAKWKRGQTCFFSCICLFWALCSIMKGFQHCTKVNDVMVPHYIVNPHVVSTEIKITEGTAYPAHLLELQHKPSHQSFHYREEDRMKLLIELRLPYRTLWLEKVLYCTKWSNPLSCRSRCKAFPWGESKNASQIPFPCAWHYYYLAMPSIHCDNGYSLERNRSKHAH